MFEGFEVLVKSPVMRERFSRVANNVLNKCFVLKKKDDTKQDYIFIKQNKELFILFFSLIDYEIKIDEELGVISIINNNGTGRLSLTKFESIMLLILKLLYLEKRNDLSTYSDHVMVSVQNIQEKYELLKVKNKKKLDKSSWQHVFSLFKRYNLIKNITANVFDSESRIEIYPSVLFAVPSEGIHHLYECIKEKLAEYERDVDNYADDEDEEAE